ncbi:hypothetical protein MASR2M78_30130 [Treponema sp.]
MKTQAISMKNSGAVHSAVITAVILLFLIGTFPLMAQDGAIVNGYARSKVGSLLENGDYFVAENTLDLRFSQAFGDAGFYGNVVLYERDGKVELPELRELYIDLHGAAFDLRMGKQQIIWGKGDGVFITDLVSPKDLSQFLIPDFEELRRAVTGARVDLYAGYHGLQLVWLPWFTPSIAPDMNSIWAPTLPFPTMPVFQATVEPEFELENGEYFAKYSYMGQSFDLALMGGYFWNDTPAYTRVSMVPLTVKGEYYRSSMAGYAVSGTLGPLVLRSEGAFYLDKRYQTSAMSYARGYAEKNALQYLVGADYSILGITFGLQYIQDIILDHDDALINDELKNTLTLVVAKTFRSETIKTELFSYLSLDTQSGLVKPKITWNLSDGLELSSGAYIFFGDEGDYGQYDKNDGIYVGAKLSF